MDKDVEAKIERLCDRYAVAAGRIAPLRPSRLPVRRAAKRTQGQLVDVLGQLQEARKPSGAALVRLAYVRAMRAFQPEARLDEVREREVAVLEQQLDYQLGIAEARVLLDFNRQMRTLVISSLPGMRTGIEKQPYDLEKAARPIITNMVHLAGTMGSRSAEVEDAA